MQITCPGCKTKLQIADGTAGGTKIQCPSCKKVMVLPGVGAAPASPPKAAGKPPGQAPAPTGKPPAPQAAPAPVTSGKPSFDDEEDGVNSYGLVRDPDLDDEEDSPPVKSSKGKGKNKDKDKDEAPAKPKKRKPEINYAPDTSIKDLRGPATIQVVTPSNYLMMQCGIVMLTAVFSIAIAVWPFMFQDRILTPAAALRDYYREMQGKGGQESKSASERWKKIDTGYVNWPKPKKKDDEGFAGEEMRPDELTAAELAVKNQMPFAVSWVVVSVLILAYSVAVAFGAVKMQALESYPWALTGAILAMIPFNGISLLVYYFKPGMNFSEDMPWILIILAVEGVFFFLVGLLCLATLLKKEVKTGFYYRSDAVG